MVVLQKVVRLAINFADTVCTERVNQKATCSTWVRVQHIVEAGRIDAAARSAAPRRNRRRWSRTIPQNIKYIS